MADTEFFARYGFERHQVSLSNWRTTPYSRWAFQNVGEIVPSTMIAAAGAAREVVEPIGSDLLDDVTVDLGSGGETARDFLSRTYTDAFVVMKSGAIIAEFYADHVAPEKPHIIFSISKSITAVVAGILESEGLLDPQAPVIDDVSENAGSAYGDCSLRDLLDMQVSLSFDEFYLNADGDYARYRRATLWNPAEGDETVGDLPGFLASLRKGADPHGGPFRYASPNSDMLGIVIERAAGRRYSDLVSDLLWTRIGAKSAAFVTVDRIGTARAAGGICTTARDLACLGEILRTDGMVGGRQVIPTHWIADMRDNGSPNAWAQGDFAGLFTGGHYRSNWYVTGDPSGSFCAIGIHGQWLHVDPQTGTVIVKLSSQPLPQDEALDAFSAAFFASFNRHLSVAP